MFLMMIVFQNSLAENITLLKNSWFLVNYNVERFIALSQLLKPFIYNIVI